MKWSEEEITRLLELVSNTPSRTHQFFNECAEKLSIEFLTQRTGSSCLVKYYYIQKRGRTFNENLPQRPANPWSDTEISRLNELVSNTPFRTSEVFRQCAATLSNEFSIQRTGTSCQAKYYDTKKKDVAAHRKRTKTSNGSRSPALPAMVASLQNIPSLSHLDVITRDGNVWIAFEQFYQTIYEKSPTLCPLLKGNMLQFLQNKEKALCTIDSGEDLIAFRALHPFCYHYSTKVAFCAKVLKEMEMCLLHTQDNLQFTSTMPAAVASLQNIPSLSHLDVITRDGNIWIAFNELYETLVDNGPTPCLLRKDSMLRFLRNKEKALCTNDSGEDLIAFRILHPLCYRFSTKVAFCAKVLKEMELCLLHIQGNLQYTPLPRRGRPEKVEKAASLTGESNTCITFYATKDTFDSWHRIRKTHNWNDSQLATYLLLCYESSLRSDVCAACGSSLSRYCSKCSDIATKETSSWQSSSQQPSSKQPTSEQPTSLQRFSQQPASPERFSQQPASLQQFSQQPASPQQFSQQPASPQRFSQQPASPEQFSQQPASPEQFSQQPASPERFSQQPASPERFSEQPASPERFSQQPASPERFSQQPASPQGFSQQPASPQQFSQQPASPQQFSQQPASLQQFSQQPASPQQFSQQPASPQRFSQQPASPEQFSQQPASPQQFSQQPASLQQFSQQPASPERFSQQPASPERFSQQPASPERFSQQPASPQGFSQQPASPERFSQQPASPERFSQQPASPQGFSQQPASPERFSQQPASPERFSQQPASPQQFSQQPASPQQFSQQPASPERFSQQPASPERFSQQPASPERFSQQPASPQQFSQQPASPQRFSQQPDSSQVKSHCPSQHQAMPLPTSLSSVTVKETCEQALHDNNYLHETKKLSNVVKGKSELRDNEKHSVVFKKTKRKYETACTNRVAMYTSEMPIVAVSNGKPAAIADESNTLHGMDSEEQCQRSDTSCHDTHDTHDTEVVTLEVSYEDGGVLFPHTTIYSLSRLTELGELDSSPSVVDDKQQKAAQLSGQDDGCRRQESALRGNCQLPEGRDVVCESVETNQPSVEHNYCGISYTSGSAENTSMFLTPVLTPNRCMLPAPVPTANDFTTAVPVSTAKEFTTAAPVPTANEFTTTAPVPTAQGFPCSQLQAGGQIILELGLAGEGLEAVLQPSSGHFGPSGVLSSIKTENIHAPSVAKKRRKTQNAPETVCAASSVDRVKDCTSEQSDAPVSTTFYSHSQSQRRGTSRPKKKRERKLAWLDNYGLFPIFVGASGQPESKSEVRTEGREEGVGEREEETPLPFKCPRCDCTMESFKLMMSHLRSHPCPDRQCPVCKKQLTIAFSLSEHVCSDRQQPGPFTCTICAATLASLKSYNIHFQNHSGSKPWVCSLCCKGFSQKSSCKSHLLIHTGLRTFSCPQCNKTFTTQNTLYWHKLTHSGNKRHICEKCGRGFLHVASLRQHLLTHTEERPYPCQLCPARFKSHKKLAEHKKWHAGERPYHYQCETCGKTFLARRSLVNHSCKTDL